MRISGGTVVITFILILIAIGAYNVNIKNNALIEECNNAGGNPIFSREDVICVKPDSIIILKR